MMAEVSEHNVKHTWASLQSGHALKPWLGIVAAQCASWSGRYLGGSTTQEHGNFLRLVERRRCGTQTHNGSDRKD